MAYIINLKEGISNGSPAVVDVIECDSYSPGTNQILGVNYTATDVLAMGVRYKVGTDEGWIPFSNILGIAIKVQ